MVEFRTTGPSDYSRHIKMLIAGFPGSKMSLFAATWEDPLILSTESLMLLADRNVPYVPIKSMQDLENVKQVLSSGSDLDFQVKTVILYSLDEIQRMMARERKASLKKDNLTAAEQMQLNDEFRAMLAGFRNLDMNILFITHLKQVSDDDGGRVFKPSLTGALSDEVVEYVDHAVVMQTINGVAVLQDSISRISTPYLQCYADNHYPWIRDDSLKLPDEFRLSFIDDFSRLQSYVYQQIIPPEVSDVEPVRDFGVVDDRGNVRKRGRPKNPTPVIEVDVPPIEDSDLKEILDSDETVPETVVQSGPLKKCQECSGDVEAEQVALSMLRFKRILCREDFIRAKQINR